MTVVKKFDPIENFHNRVAFERRNAEIDEQLLGHHDPCRLAVAEEAGTQTWAPVPGHPGYLVSTALWVASLKMRGVHIMSCTSGKVRLKTNGEYVLCSPMDLAVEAHGRESVVAKLAELGDIRDKVAEAWDAGGSFEGIAESLGVTRFRVILFVSRLIDTKRVRRRSLQITTGSQDERL